MARQRFIWPNFWDDPDLGRLTALERLLYIACFSLADDEGRLIAEPLQLRGTAFAYADPRISHISKSLKRLSEACSSFHIYHVNGIQYVQFLNWHDWQKPKYPSPSRLPPPPDHSPNDSRKWSRNDSRNDSRKPPETIPPRVGTGQEDLKSLKPLTQTPKVDAAPAEEIDMSRIDSSLHAMRLFATIRPDHQDERTKVILESYSSKLPPAAFEDIRERMLALRATISNDGKWVNSELKRLAGERTGAAA